MTLALILGGAGVASAANGGSFLLGKANKESATASLANSTGTPLSLSAPKGRAPLAVNQKAMVKNLNAQFTGGLAAGQLEATGGAGFTPLMTNTPISNSPVRVARTGKLPAGTYYVTATALISLAPGDGIAICAISKAPTPTLLLTDGAGRSTGFNTVAETAVVSMHAGDRLVEFCEAGGNNGSVVVDSGILAIHILASHGTAPVSATRPTRTLLPGLLHPAAPAHRGR